MKRFGRKNIETLELDEDEIILAMIEHPKLDGTSYRGQWRSCSGGASCGESRGGALESFYNCF